MNDLLHGEETYSETFVCFWLQSVKILYKMNGCTVIPALINASMQAFIIEFINSMMEHPSHNYSIAEVNCTPKSVYFSDYHSTDGD